MKLTLKQQIIGILLFSFLLLFVESLLKYYIILNKIPEQGFYLFSLLKIDFYTNYNIAFGLPLPQAFTIVLVIIILIVLSIIWWRSLFKFNIWQTFGISLIIIGALSNLIDRLIYGFVIDYINIFIWPVFNLADAMIVIGVIFYLVSEFKLSKKK